MKTLRSTIVSFMGLACTLPYIGSARADEPIRFNRDIRPILSENCFACHGPDRNKRQAGLRLDSQEGLHGTANQPNGKPGVVMPGKPDDSELIKRILSADPDERMPPAESGKTLTPKEIELLKRWVAEGAGFEGHWAFLPRNAKPAANPQGPAAEFDRRATAKLDVQISAPLAKIGLSPSREADRITLIRRLYFDLVGLPPGEAQVDAFLNDKSPDAYERAVDGLLASPHYGERLAMWWLDLVRYADTVGYHGDQEMSVSPFRQYVIGSFNANKPFDQFTVEQLAGDLLPNRTREQLIASGYNRLGMMSAEGGVQDKEYLAKYMSERVRNASGTWLGVTLGCCECHDHKFDPFPTRDFYRFGAFFADIKERGLYSGANDDGNWGSFIKVPTADQEAEQARLTKRGEDLKAILDRPTSELAEAQKEWEKTRVLWTPLKPETVTSKEGAMLALQPDGSILASGPSPATDTYTLTFRNLPANVTAVRLEVLPDDSFPKRGPGRAGNGNFVLTEFQANVKPAEGDAASVAFQNPTATYEQTGAAGNNPYKKWAVAAALDGDAQGPTWGWAIMEQVGQPHSAIFETAKDLSLKEGETLSIALLQNLDNPQHTIGRFRLSVATASRPVRAADQLPPAIAEIVARSEADRTPEQRDQLAAYYRGIAPALEPQRRELAEVEQRRKVLEKSITSTLITEQVPPRMIRVLARGNWMDEKGEVVEPAFPVLFNGPATPDHRLTRLDLARWIVSPEQPLTARVLSNRLWKLFFGAGLSRKVDDLGAQGEWPSHPELLDELAQWMIDTGWDLKRWIKIIVMSKTYRQSSVVSEEMRAKDPYNRWLARQGRFRLDAEVVRDNALSISGLLVSKIGGKSVRPYQPPGYWAYLNFPQREWQNGTGDELYRRGLYTHWQRQYLHPSLLAFDAPSREECTADRPRSNTPLQSLVLLNDPTYVEAARTFAELILRHEGDVRQKLDFAFRRALSRPVTDQEAGLLQKLLETQHKEYAERPAAAKELLSQGARPAATDLDPVLQAAWTNVARVILNLHESITRY
jgi:hypothetical protein